MKQSCCSALGETPGLPAADADAADADAAASAEADAACRLLGLTKAPADES